MEAQEIELATIDPIINSKLNIISSSGCTAAELSVNNILEIDMTDEQCKFVLCKIMEWYNTHLSEFNNLLDFFVTTQYSDYQCSDKCSCCGDYISTFKITI